MNVLVKQINRTVTSVQFSQEDVQNLIMDRLTEANQIDPWLPVQFNFYMEGNMSGDVVLCVDVVQIVEKVA